MLIFLTLFCAVSFLGYGISCLATEHMVREFERYGLPRYRILTGVLQLLAAAGLLAGLYSPKIGAMAAGGLALQMALGLAVRLKIRDRFFQCLPALVYLGISAWLCAQFVGRLIR